MRKSISSAFILLLLLLVLWGISSWYLGTKTEQNLKRFFANNRDNSTELFQFKLLAYSSSIFSSNIKVIANINKQMTFGRFFDESFDDVPLHVVINNGPFFIDNSGVSRGASQWKISLDKDSVDKMTEDIQIDNLFYNTIYNQWNRADITFDFESNAKYQLALKPEMADILVKGDYKAQQFMNSGSVTTEKLSFINNYSRIDSKNIDIKFKLVTKSKNDKDISFKVSAPQLVYQHQSLTEPVRLDVASEGSISLNDDLLSSSTQVHLKNHQESVYPISKSDLKLEVKALDLMSLLTVLSDTSKIKNLEQQIDWVLEDQGELPEGQDKIWQLQDSVNKHRADLPELMSSLLHPKKRVEDAVTFSLKAYNLNTSSTLMGSLQLLPESISADSSANKSVLSLTQLRADVELDESLFDFVSKTVPIKDDKFKLIYRQNKLLMQ